MADSSFDRSTRKRFQWQAVIAAVLAGGVLLAITAPAASAAAPDTTITSGPPDRINHRSAFFTFTASGGRARFSYKLDRRAWTPFSARAFAHLRGLRPGVHIFRVRAGDGAGHVDATPAVARIVVDLTPPRARFRSGPKGAGPRKRGFKSATATFRFVSSERRSTFTCSVDGHSPLPCASPLTVQVTRNGWHNVVVRATDRAGNASRAFRRSWKVGDHTPPTARIVIAPASAGSTSSVEFVFTTTKREPGARFRCSLDGSIYRFCTSPASYNQLRLGTHRFVLEAVDSVGNISRPLPYAWIVSSRVTPPNTTISSGPAAFSSAPTATFRFFASRTPARFECALDGSAWLACGSPLNLAALKSGAHTFRVRAIDAQGNVDDTPAVWNWTISATANWKLLIADNMSTKKRILITDFSGRIVWEFDNPTGNGSSFAGPLGVRWMPNGHILATFGTGKVGEIDPATKTFVHKTTGDGFQSPYDAQLLSDGNLAVATRFNSGGRVAVFRGWSSTIVWSRAVPQAHTLEFRPAGTGYHTSLPTLIVGGFGDLEEVTYQPGGPQTVVWSGHSEFTHRVIVDSDGNLVATEGYYFHRFTRAGSELWRVQKNPTEESRGIAENPVTPGFIFVILSDNAIEFYDRNGHFQRLWRQLSDGSILQHPYGLRTIQYPG
jgi:hypothetical protein